jgi:hypothetical protein
MAAAQAAYAWRPALFRWSDTTKRYSTFGFGMALLPAASSMSDPTSAAAVVLHIDLGC